MFNSFFRSVRHLLRSIGIVALDVLAAAAAYFVVFFLPQVAMLLILFACPLIACINCYFFTASFRKYMPKKEEHKETDMVPLMDDDNKEVEEAINNLKGN